MSAAEDVAAGRTFVVRPQHLALLARANWVWNPARHGAPMVDPKRTYSGFSTDVFADIAEAVDPAGWALACANGEVGIDAYTRDRAQVYAQWHRETVQALTAVLRAGCLEPGLYAHDARGERWVRVGPVPSSAA